MRKVFLSMMVLQSPKQAEYVSDDFDLGNVQYQFPITYLIAENIEENDEILVVTGVELSGGQQSPCMQSYQMLQEEINLIVQQKHAQVKYVELDADKNFTSLTFNRFFKSVADKIQENDVLFVDITFGMKPYGFSLFIALAYVVRACENIELDTLIYAQMFNGSQKAESVNKSIIYDLTGLFYLNQIACKAENGDRKALDGMLNFIIKED